MCGEILMKKPFISETFLLETAAAQTLYRDYAEAMPIIDYHSHLPVDHIAADTRFENIAQLWLAGDHYKWRCMRTNGIDERYCTGDASDWEKFNAWSQTVPKMLRNPLYHWTHLELLRYFGIADRLLDSRSARDIWNRCNEQIASEEFSTRRLLTKMNVNYLCTTDDPTDTLEHHRALAADKTFPIVVLPTFRPDKAMAVENPSVYIQWIEKLENAVGSSVSSFASLIEALRARHDFFHARGCRISDHGINTVYAESYTENDVDTIFKAVRKGTAVSEDKIAVFKSAVLYECALMDYERGWTQQLHLGALRNNNTKMFKQLGPDTGFDSIGDFSVAHPLATLFDRCERIGKLPKTIVYNLNPKDNAVLATMIGNFQDGTVAGKMQFGSAWWFLDQKSGIEEQLDVLSNMGLLSRFVGMLTDSRSFLSFPRHEYFRRILCNCLGNDIKKGLIPEDMPLVGEMVQDICYNNAVSYFNFPHTNELE
jgi:glucuronate isomerase